MGTRTYSRRGANGEIRLTAEGRRRAGLAAVNIFGEQVPERPAATTEAGTPAWVRPVAPKTEGELRAWETGARDGSFEDRQWRELTGSVYRAQLAYQDNPTPQTYQNMLTAVGYLESRYSGRNLQSAVRGQRSSEGTIASFVEEAEAAGFMPALPPDVFAAGPDGFQKYGMYDLEGMSNDYYETYFADPRAMTVDTKQAVTELGGGSFENGVRQVRQSVDASRAARLEADEASKKAFGILDRLDERVGRDRIREIVNELGRGANALNDASQTQRFDAAVRDLTRGRIERRERVGRRMQTITTTFPPMTAAAARQLMQDIASVDQFRTEVSNAMRSRRYNSSAPLGDTMSNTLRFNQAYQQRDLAVANMQTKLFTALDQLFA